MIKQAVAIRLSKIVCERCRDHYFCERCPERCQVTDKILDPSALTKQRKRLGKEFLEELEKKVYEVLIEKKLLKAKGMYVDATVFPESIKYPNVTWGY